MYIELLKQLYYNERKKLESMWIFKQESKLRLLQLRKNISERMQERLNISELSGRCDIAEEIKDKLLKDGDNEYKVQERIDKNINDDLSEIKKNIQEEMRNTNYPADEYADYLCQLEKICALEDAISEARLFPEEVYNEQEAVNDKRG